MIGIGTSSVDLSSHQYKFASFLGLDNQSWGYSYRGLIQHQGRMKYYGKKFSVGCIVGVYVDTFKGHLEFYINRRFVNLVFYFIYNFIRCVFPLHSSQGIAYRNLTIAPGTLLYPMICSTSAKSSVKLINAIENRESLQFRCMKVIGRHPELVQVPHTFYCLSKILNMFGCRKLSRFLAYVYCAGTPGSCNAKNSISITSFARTIYCSKMMSSCVVQKERRKDDASWWLLQVNKY